MARVFIAVGSNLDPITNVPGALRLMKEFVEPEAVSDFYETDPVGQLEQPAFANGIFLISTHLGPRELKFDVLRNVENRLGRTRTADKYASRTIDLDMILYDDLVLDELDLVIPDPDICKRAFVIIPVCELDPNLIVPGESASVSEIAYRMKDIPMRRLDDLTNLLRSELNNESREN